MMRYNLNNEIHGGVQMILRRNQHLEEIRKKVIDILKRKHDLEAYVKMKKDEIMYLTQIVLPSDELVDLYECPEDVLYKIYCYMNITPVEREVFKNGTREKKRAIKRALIKKSIETSKSNLGIKEAILLMIDDTLNNMNSDYLLLIKLCYTERKITRDRFEDIVERFNDGRKNKLASKTIEQYRDEAILIITKRLKDMDIMNCYRIGE